VTPYVFREQILPETLLGDLADATAFMTALPDPGDDAVEAPRMSRLAGPPKRFWSCHALARAFLRITGDSSAWRVADGYFMRRGSEHSWLWRHVEDTVAVLDLYPVAGAAPMLVDAGGRSPWGAAYIESAMSYRQAILDTWEREADAICRAWNTVGARQP